MKLKYIKPQASSTVLPCESDLLAGSTGYGQSQSGEGGGDPAESKGFTFTTPDDSWSPEETNLWKDQ